MKYTAISMIIIVGYWIWKYIAAVIERGLPTHPVYYISSVIGIIMGFITYRLYYRLFRLNIIKRRYALIPVFIIILSISFNISSVDILKQIGSGLLFWYMLSGLGFYTYFLFRLRSSKKESTEVGKWEESLKRVESLNKVLVYILAVTFVIVIISEL